MGSAEQTTWTRLCECRKASLTDRASNLFIRFEWTHIIRNASHALWAALSFFPCRHGRATEQHQQPIDAVDTSFQPHGAQTLTLGYYIYAIGKFRERTQICVYQIRESWPKRYRRLAGLKSRHRMIYAGQRVMSIHTQNELSASPAVHITPYW